MNKSKQKNIEAVYPLSPMQQGMLFHTILEEEGGLYFEQTTFKVRGSFDVDAFKKALEKTMERNPILRTSFVYKKQDVPLQVVQKEVELPFAELDWSGQTDGAVHTEMLEKFLAEDRAKGFKLAKAPLIRLAVIRLKQDVWQLVWSNHHILFDGWSLPILLKEVFSFYESYIRGQAFDLPRKRPYRDYILWLQKQDMQQAEHFWKEFLQGFSAPNAIPLLNFDIDPQKENAYLKETFHLPQHTADKLNTLARANQLTMNTIVQGAWSILLHRYTGDEDIVFGATVSGRPPELQGVEETPGLFINTLPVRVPVNPHESALNVLTEIQKRSVELREYEYTPLADIQSWSSVPGHSSLFESLIVFENYPVDESMKNQMSSLDIFDVHTNERTNYPISLIAGAHSGLSLDIAYDSTQFSTKSINGMLKQMGLILEQIANVPEIRVQDLNLLDSDDVNQILVNWNQTKTEYPDTLCVQQVFEQQVTERADAPALVFNDRQYTYAQLNSKINQLAHYLRAKDLGPEQKAAVYLDRSVESIISLMAVIKAGASYVPIDPEYPLERVEFILKDSDASICISDSKYLEKIAHLNLPGLNWDNERGAIDSEKTDNPVFRNHPDNLAYIIYTSGSTGTPKGTLLQHRGAVNTAQSIGKTFKMEPEKRVLQFASIGFDASVAEIFGALLNGAVLHLISKDTILSERGLSDVLRNQKISTIIFPPSVLAVLDHQNLPDLKVAGSAGEACTPDIVARWAPGRTFVNGYGPTESTVAAAMLSIKEATTFERSVPIGFPMQNAQLYVLDPWLHPQPPGVPGELHIASVGLARGYLNRPDLTAEKFIPNPFSDEPGMRLYKSGDLVRWLPDGSLEFMGRIDFQVKLRGFRIELGEIENVFCDFESISDAAVLLREDEPGQKYLAAYLVKNTKAELDRSALQRYLKEHLPEYMVPPVFVEMEQFPLTPSGKVDRKALPVPEDGAGGSTEKIMPRTPAEELLVNLVRSVLKIADAGVNDNFFELGGHSLLATQMLSRIRDAFGVELPLRDFFENPVLADLALKIEQLRLTDQSLAAPPIEQTDHSSELPLSFAQQRLWFLDQLAPGSANYNIPTVLRLKGQLNVDVLERCVQEILSRHEVLRTTFSEQREGPVQTVHEEIDFKFPIQDLSHLPAVEAEEQAREIAKTDAVTGFDLAKGPLFRGRLLKLADQDHVVIFTLHHTITDGWSMGILIKEVALLYPAFLEGKPSPLPDLPIQYGDYAVWQRNWLRGEVLEKQLEFWKELIGENPPVLELPTDRPRPAVQTFNGQTLKLNLSAEFTAQVKQFSQKEGATLFMTLLAAFQTLLHRYSGQDNILVGSPIANRTQSATEQLIGFFVNTLTFKADFSSVTNFKALLKQLRETTLQSYAHQDLPFEQLVEALHVERDMSHSPLFQVAFILQNMDIEKLELPDLSLEPFEAKGQIAKYDLTLTTAETENAIDCYFEYNTDLFNATTIERMMQHFRNILKEVVANPKQQLNQLDFLTDEEKQNLFQKWNQTAFELPQEATVPRVFESFVHRAGDQTAAQFGDSNLSYSALNARANQLANHLLSAGLQKDQIVGISLPRSLDIPVAILGILKAGGAFLSIDPAYPADRISYMLEDSGLKFLITLENMLETLPVNGTPVICLDRDAETISNQNTENLLLDISDENLAYVIYTSGSTGKPKGTMLAHRGLINLAQAQQKAFSISKTSKILQFASLSFDASVWETAMALLNGAALVLAEQEALTSGQGLASVLKEQQISTVTLPPSVLAVMPQEELPDLKTIITAGEKCTSDLVKRWGENRQFVNAYGPTETTVCASMFETSPSDDREPPIGKPIDNFQLYVLDAHWQPAALGVPGELCIAGAGLARGYLNRPDLTADKFIPNPFGQQSGSRLYRSGDLVRWLPDGNMEFLGRIDHQVKVRGFRIELGEIEAVLTGFDKIRDVAVLAREDKPGHQRLVAYYVSEDGNALDVNELRSHVQKQVPEYMVPSVFVHLESMPLNTSGKVDRKVLPVPELSRDALKTEFVAPRNAEEEKLAEIVCDLLSLDKVGVYDNFFELGGHSLLATQFISNIREEFQVDIPLRILFETPTIEGLAEAILNPETTLSAQDDQRIEQVERGNDDLDALLAELDGMSDEEAKLLLEDDPEGADTND